MKSLFIVVVAFVAITREVVSESATGLSDVSGHNSCLFENILRLERAVNNMSWELQLTKTDLQGAKKSLDLTKQELQSTEMRLDSTNAVIINLTNIVGEKSEVSYQVRQLKQPLTVGHNAVLKFDDVTLNNGAAYNPTSGIFTVPKTGFYLLWANIMSPDASYFVIKLMKEDTVLVKGFTSRVSLHGVATITYLTKLLKGEHVRFVMEVQTGSAVHGNTYSSYGGNLMYV